MKKLLLLFSLLFLCASSALAEYDGYLLAAPDTEKMLTWAVYPLDAHNAVVFSHPRDLEGTPARWTWYRDGQIFRDLSFFAMGDQGNLGSALFSLQPDGRVKALIPTRVGSSGVPVGNGSEYPVVRWDSLDWTENGLENPTEVFTGTRAVFVCGSLVLSVDSVLPGPRVAFLNDTEGRLLWQCTLPVSDGFHVDGALALDDGGFLLYGHEQGQKDRPQAMRLENGQISWQWEIAPVGYRGPMPDGKGGFFIVHDPNRGDDAALEVLHYGEDGRIDGKGMLTGGGVVKSVDGGLARSDGQYTLYGAAVANSKRIYTVFALSFDPITGKQTLDVRDLDQDYRDYGPRIYMAPDGSPWVFSADQSGRGAPPALIPFDRLPASARDLPLSMQ